MNITFNSTVCTDGWIIVDKDQLEGSTAKNWHIVEVKLDDNDVVIKRSTKTFCGENLKDVIDWDRNNHVFRNDFAGRCRLRNVMARLQNTIAEEFCGRCAAHLYLG